MPRLPNLSKKTSAAKAKKLEQFYSNDFIQENMRVAIKRYVPNADIYIDPSCGDCTFLLSCPSTAFRLGFDIDPKQKPVEHNLKVVKCDFNTDKAWTIITEVMSDFQRETGRKANICVASNPPFKQLKKWFVRVSEIADWVMWIGPQQYMRTAYQDEIPTNFELHWQKIMRNSSFDFCSQETERLTILQLWKRSNISFSNLSNYAFSQFPISDWRIAPWSEFNSKGNVFKLCMSVKSGHMWRTNSLCSFNQRCKIKKGSYPISVSKLIICQNEIVMKKLLQLNSLVKEYPVPKGCTRDSFHWKEMCWLWLKVYEPREWELMSKNTTSKLLLKSRKRNDISLLDKYLFSNKT